VDKKNGYPAKQQSVLSFFILIIPVIYLRSIFILLFGLEIGTGFIYPFKDDFFVRFFPAGTEIPAYVQISLCEVLTINTSFFHNQQPLLSNNQRTQD